MSEGPAPSRRLPAHLASLTGLRAVAVAWVFCFHVTGEGGTPLLRSGSLGVNLFFVLSGFLITAILVAGIEDRGLRYGAFLARRALRLVPALVLLVLVVASVATLTNTAGSEQTTAAVPFVMTYTSNIALLTVAPNLGMFSHTWSLALEEQFYLCWPLLLGLLVARTSRATTVKVVTALAVLAATARALVAVTGRSGLSLQADTLLIGCLAGLAFCWGPASLTAGRFTGRLLAVAWATTSVVLVFVPHTAPVLPLVGYPAFSLTAALSLLRLAHRHSGTIVPRALSSSVVVYVGTISYGIYLWHLPVLDIVRDRGLSEVASAFVALAITLAVAALSYHFWERPFLRVKDRLADRVPLPKASEAAAGPVGLGARMDEGEARRFLGFKDSAG